MLPKGMSLGHCFSKGSSCECISEMAWSLLHVLLLESWRDCPFLPSSDEPPCYPLLIWNCVSLEHFTWWREQDCARGDLLSHTYCWCTLELLYLFCPFLLINRYFVAENTLLCTYHLPWKWPEEGGNNCRASQVVWKWWTYQFHSVCYLFSWTSKSFWRI